MQNPRNRIQIDEEYASALGRAAYCFAICEWNAVWSADRLQANYIATVEAERKTAGVIAKDLIKLVNEMTNTNLKAICLPPSKEFHRLVKERNALLHGKPGTSSNSDQRLFRQGQEWTLSAIDTFSDEVAACSIDLNAMVHQHLITP